MLLLTPFLCKRENVQISLKIKDEWVFRILHVNGACATFIDMSRVLGRCDQTISVYYGPFVMQIVNWKEDFEKNVYCQHDLVCRLKQKHGKISRAQDPRMIKKYGIDKETINTILKIE